MPFKAVVWLSLTLGRTIKAMHADQQRQYSSNAAIGVACAGLFSVFEFLPLQTLPARRECKGMAATLREGTAPKLVQVNASPVAGETIASKTARAGNTPQGAAMGLARPIARRFHANSNFAKSQRAAILPRTKEQAPT